MSLANNQEVLLTPKDTKKWFKFIVTSLPDMLSEFFDMEFKAANTIVPFMYGQLEEEDEEVAFDINLSTPMLNIVYPIFLVKNNVKKQFSLMPIGTIAPEHEARIYIPVGLVFGIIPLKKDDMVVKKLEEVASPIYSPTAEEVGNIINVAKGSPHGKK